MTGSNWERSMEGTDGLVSEFCIEKLPHPQPLSRGERGEEDRGEGVNQMD
jgi:hypothetical protein